jgi:hypothetical protein
MDTSEKQFDETEVQAGDVNIATPQTTTKIVTQKQLDNLLSQTAKEACL